MFYLLCLLVSSWISSTSALAFDVSSKSLGFYGLGTMGEHMAGHLHKLAEEGGGKVRVASRDTEKARRWADARGAIHCDSFDELSKECDVVCMCLSTTDVVEEVLRKCDFLKAGQLLIDCTSGEPERMKVLGEKLSSQGVKLVDSPVSGGPAGAEAGTLTSMLGGSVSDVADAMKVVDAWSGKSVRCGDIGSGDAVKAINNVLNTAHVLLAAEASLVLQKYGVDASIALDVINSSSGRSLQTERLPATVLSRSFDFGFALALMRKDVVIADQLVQKFAPTHTLIPEVKRLIIDAEKKVGGDADYTEVARLLEERVGEELC